LKAELVHVPFELVDADGEVVVPPVILEGRGSTKPSRRTA